MDHSLPEFTNALTAMSVKKKIDESSKFIFLATARPLTSRWCNWELGIAYSRKDLQVAIFPVETWRGKWSGNEYLHLYPVIEKSAPIEVLTLGDLKIRYTDNQIMEFGEWLERS